MIRDHTNLVVRIGFITVVLLMLIVGGVSLQRYENLSIEVRSIVDNNNRKIELAGNMRELIRQRALIMNAMLSSGSATQREQNYNKFTSLGGEYNEARRQLLALGLREQERAIHKDLAKAVAQSSPLDYKLAALIIKQAPLDEIRQARENAVKIRAKVLSRLGDLMTLQRENAVAALRTAEETNRSTHVFLFIMGVISVLISLLIASLVSKYVSVRKAEINNKNRELELTNKVKVEFLANMTHELRTPLNAIIGYSELLEDEADDTGLAECKKDFERISGAGRHLLQMIDEVLDMTKIEAGKMQVHCANTNIQQILHELSSELVPALAANNNKLRITDTSNIDSIETDSLKLHSILSNILGNSCKFSKNGCIDLAVEKYQDNIRFMVRDNGIGIPQDRLNNLFEPFMSEGSIYTREHEGTGLGLAITKTYCDMLGGSISVKSEVAMGTEFVVSFPLARQSDSDAVPASSFVSQPGAMLQRG